MLSIIVLIILNILYFVSSRGDSFLDYQFREKALRRLFAGFWYVNKATWHRCDYQVLFLQRELARKNFVKLRSG